MMSALVDIAVDFAFELSLELAGEALSRRVKALFGPIM
jgi:hypothetical protein